MEKLDIRLMGFKGPLYENRLFLSGIRPKINWAIFLTLVISMLNTLFLSLYPLYPYYIYIYIYIIVIAIREREVVIGKIRGSI